MKNPEVWRYDEDGGDGSCVVVVYQRFQGAEYVAVILEPGSVDYRMVISNRDAGDAKQLAEQRVKQDLFQKWQTPQKLNALP